MPEIDNIIIGGGPGGYTLARGLAARGESVLLVERDTLGGTCLNRGCIPTKCLCASAEAYTQARTLDRYGVSVNVEGYDYAVMLSRMNHVVDSLREGIVHSLAGVDIIHGEANMTAPRCIAVNGDAFTAKRLVIATGAAPSRPGIPGIEYTVSSDDFLKMEEIPQRLAIIGGGVIGLEIASIASALGAEVTVIEYCREILPAFDPDLAKRLRQALSRRGVTFLTGTAVKGISAERTITTEGKRGPIEIHADCVLCATGRHPVLPAGCAEAGIKIDSRGFVTVDSHMACNQPGVYAIGDVNGLSMLAHSAEAQARVVLNDAPSCFDRNLVPSVVFTDPELATVGATPAALDNAGIAYHTVKRQFASIGKACAAGAADGLAKFSVADGDGRILAVSMMGSHVSDLIAEATILIKEGVQLEDISSRYIHAHPPCQKYSSDDPATHNQNY